MTNNYIYIYSFDELGVPHAHPGGPHREPLNWQGWPFRKRTVPLLRRANHMQLAPQSEFLVVLAGPSIQQLVWLVALLPFWSFTINTHEPPQWWWMETIPQLGKCWHPTRCIQGIFEYCHELNIVYRDLKPVTRPKTSQNHTRERERLNPGQWRITSAPWDHGLFPKVDVSDARSPHLDEFDHDFTSWRHLNDG